MIIIAVRTKTIRYEIKKLSANFETIVFFPLSEFFDKRIRAVRSQRARGYLYHFVCSKKLIEKIHFLIAYFFSLRSYLSVLIYRSVCRVLTKYLDNSIDTKCVFCILLDVYDTTECYQKNNNKLIVHWNGERAKDWLILMIIAYHYDFQKKKKPSPRIV